jgi:hypothetical protein
VQSGEPLIVLRRDVPTESWFLRIRVERNEFRTQQVSRVEALYKALVQEAGRLHVDRLLS